MRETENIRAVEALGVDMMGFIFWPHSSRYVATRPHYLPCTARKVGVFVDADIEQVKDTADVFDLDFVQLHGHESPAYCAQLQGHQVIKAFNIATSADLSQTADYEGLATYFLFDTKGKCAGGNGQQFDWNILMHYEGHTPFLLSGGIGPDDWERIHQFHHPRLAGIDLNSRFETSPALKDTTLLKHFLDNVKNNH